MTVRVVNLEPVHYKGFAGGLIRLARIWWQSFIIKGALNAPLQHRLINIQCD
jgi:hypothetical protein